VQCIFDLPMPADPGGELVRTGLVRAQVGDRVDGLGAPLAVTAGGSGPAGELDGGVKRRGLAVGDTMAIDADTPSAEQHRDRCTRPGEAPPAGRTLSR
jgi:hypothetical protein